MKIFFAYILIACYAITNKNLINCSSQTLLKPNAWCPDLLTSSLIINCNRQSARYGNFGLYRPRGTQCNIRCTRGFIMKNPAEGKKRICQSNGEWTGKDPICERNPDAKLPITCAIPPELEHGTVINCAKDEKININTICKFRCNPGYKLAGPKLLKCHSNGRLIDERGQYTNPKCIGITCPNTLSLNYGTILNCGGRPRITFGETCEFRCNPGYQLVGASSLKCDSNGRFTDEHGRLSRPVCRVANTCQNPRPLHHGKVLHCESQRLSINDTCQFQCDPGFELVGPSSLTCNSNGWMVDEYGRYSRPVCQDIDECSSQELIDKCPYGCHNTLGSYTCYCARGYQLVDGYRCEDIDECARRETHNCEYNCHNTNGDYTCSCPSGFNLVYGSRCRDIDECSSQDLHECDHSCHNTIGSYRCSCGRGFTLVGRFKCEDIDECSLEHLHKCSHRCINTIGSYKCSCEPGYILIDGFKCEGCRKNSYRRENVMECVECPQNSYTESEGKTSVKDCLCYPGFIRDDSHGVSCIDIDECEVNNYGCSYMCINTPGGVHCACPVGFELKEDNKTCIDIDECKIKNGGCQGLCHNTIGSFSCSCHEGYVPSKTDPYSCDDVDECKENNGGCSQICENFPGGHYCTCKEGYRLESNQKSCAAIKCIKQTTPRFSKMQCHSKIKANAPPNSWTDNKTPNSPLDEFSLGTTCKFKCNKGYKSSLLPGIITCKSDGQWEGNIPECIAMQCPQLTPPEHGELFPRSCVKGDFSVRKRCSIKCEPGFRLQGKFTYTCKNNLTWTPVFNSSCIPGKIRPVISCPEDITATLPEGESFMAVPVPPPITNMDEFEVDPDWVIVNENITFPAGQTNVKFVVKSPYEDEDHCTMHVNILDQEPPKLEYCPESINATATDINGARIVWDEPNFTDNIGIASLTQTLKPNTTLTVGTHIAQYIAKDKNGNTAKCSFEINIEPTLCSDLIGPNHGEANCMDWLLGKLCIPSCDPGYTHYSNETLYFSCDDSGLWNPSNVVPDCLPECPPNFYWSSELEKCEENV